MITLMMRSSGEAVEKKGDMTMVVRSARRARPFAFLLGGMLWGMRFVPGGASTLMKTFIVSRTHPLGQALKSVARLILNALPPQSLITTTGGGAVSGIKTPTDAG